MSKRILGAFILGCLSFMTYAQEVKGIVVNELNQPLEDVYVYNINSESHTHTSENGVFVSTNTKIADSIRVRLLGYKTRTIQVKKHHRF